MGVEVTQERQNCSAALGHALVAIHAGYQHISFRSENFHDADSVFNDEIGWPLAISRKTVKKYLVYFDGLESGIYSGFDQQCAVQCQLGPVLSGTLGRAARWGATAVRSAGRLSAVGWSCSLFTASVLN